MTDSRVTLPCHDSASWEEAKRYFNLIAGVHSLQEFGELLGSSEREEGSPWLRTRLECISGLRVFLEEHCSEEDRAVFFERTLPFIANSATCLEKRVPESGVPFLRKQENASLVLGRQLVVSLLANAFLCAFPDEKYARTPPEQQQQQQQQQQEGNGAENKEKLYLFSFFGLYERLQKPTKKTPAIAAKLKCIMAYFHRLAENRCDLSGTITFKRQVLPLKDVPSLEMWQASQHSLSSVRVESSHGIEDSGSHTLQVDFANRHVSGGVLEGGCVQEEIRFSICPELLVARLVVEQLEDNEAMIITGAERFAGYRGYGESLQFDGELEEKSDRDMFGNILTSIVAIDATPFVKSLSPEEQYTHHYLLRELNKAFAGFLCQHDRGDLTAELIALRVQSDVNQLVMSENYPPPPLPISPNSYNTGASEPSSNFTRAVPHQPTMVRTQTGTASITQPPVPADTSAFPSLTVPSATPKPSSSADKGEEEVEKYAVDLSESILTSVLSEPPAKKRTREEGERDGEPTSETEKVGMYALNLSESILTSVFSKPQTTTTTMAKEVRGTTEKDGERTTSASEVVAEKLSSSLFAGISGKSNRKREKNVASASRIADVLANSIISEVLSQNWTGPNSPPSSPRTMGQPTSPAIEWKIHSLADGMADSIISSVLGASLPSQACVPKRPIESGRSSRSSSLTGQTITLHEFTDDMVEGAVREGLLVASLQMRGAENASGVGKAGVHGEGVSVSVGSGGDKSGGSDEGRGRIKTVRSGLAQGRNAGDLAENLVMQSIQSVLNDRNRKKGTNNRDKTGGLGPSCAVGVTSGGRTESPVRPSVKAIHLRHTVDKPKLLVDSIANGTTDTGDLDRSASGSMLHLEAPSSRMSCVWSIASTRDEESRPVSPTDLDRMALSFVGSLEEYYSMFAELVIRTAIAEVTGNKKYICHVPIKDHSHMEDYMAGDVRMQVPTTDYSRHNTATGGILATDGHMTSRMDTFLSTLGEAEPLGGGEVGEGGEQGEFGERTPSIHKALLRPVATGNWGCGAFGGDPQLKSMLQWVAVSVTGRGEMIYFPYTDSRMEQLQLVTTHLHTKQWTVGKLLSAVMEFCQLCKEDRENKTLFSHLLQQ